MADTDGLAVSCAHVADLGFKLAHEAIDYSEDICDADSRIKDLAKDVELTSEVFQEASAVFDDSEIKAVLSQSAKRTVRTLLEACRGIFGDLDATLEHGRVNKQAWPFELHKFEMFNADLDLKNDTMRLLLLTLQSACHGLPADCASSTDDDPVQKMEKLISAIEASGRRFESFRANVISRDDVSVSASSESAMCVPEMGSTEFTYIDDSPPSPVQPTPMASAFSDTDNTIPDDVHVEPLNVQAPARRTSALTLDLKNCIEHVQGVLHHIEEAKTSRSGAEALNSTEARDLMHAFTRTSVVLEEIVTGKKKSVGPSEYTRQESRQPSLVASTGFGSYCPPCHGGLRKRWAKIERKVTEEVKEVSQRVNLSVSWLRVRFQQGLRSRVSSQKPEKLPVRFTDVLGRKFSFPWRACCTWKSMEDLVKQAFAFDASVCQYVYRGQYDLVGPDGSVILPMLWAATVRPGWTVTMQMPHFDIHAFVDKSPSPRQRIPSFHNPWNGADIERGRSLIRRRSHSPIVIDVVEGPTGIEIVRPAHTTGLCPSRSEPILQARRTAISVPRQRPGTTEGYSGTHDGPILIDVSPRPRTRGKDRAKDLSRRAQRSMSPVPPPPPPPPPPPAVVDVDEALAEVRVLMPESSYSDSDSASCSSDADESLFNSRQACRVPSTAEEALKRWTNAFD